MRPGQVREIESPIGVEVREQRDEAQLGGAAHGGVAGAERVEQRLGARAFAELRQHAQRLGLIGARGPRELHDAFEAREIVDAPQRIGGGERAQRLLRSEHAREHVGRGRDAALL
ncbi:MAG: hypothetical protein IPJ19_08035 [Planctomycetes bacterium]|nr:hypothetical protein [Planctomycetota bacterium]